VNWLLDFFENVATDFTPILTPTAHIILFFCICYFGYREKQNSKKVIIPTLLQRILFLNNTQYTLVTIIFQAIIVSVTILSLLLLLVPDINRIIVTFIHSLIMLTIILIQSILRIMAELLNKKRKNHN